jgi:uncharacterized protein
MALINTIQDDLKSAIFAKDELKASVLRMLLSATKYKRIDLGRELVDEDVVGVVQKEIKQRKESIDAYRATRPDLADKEEAEMRILEVYLPKQISESELEQIVKDAISLTGASTVKDMGKVIGEVKSKVGSSADGARVSAEVKKQLGV